MKFICLSLLFVLCSFSSWTKEIRAEQKYMIDHLFKEDANFRQKLISIDDNILTGNYKQAKETIGELHKTNLSPLKESALLCYEATLAYNESDYQRSIDLCIKSLTIQNKLPERNAYWLKAMNFKAKGYGALNDYEKGELILDTAIQHAERTLDFYGLGASFYYMGTFYADRGEFKKASTYMLKSIALREKTNDIVGLAASYSFLGLCYSNTDDYIKGVDYIQKSIQLREQVNDKRGLANSYLTLYKVYYEIEEYQKAMDSEFKSLAICKELQDLQCISGRYTNIGQLYQKLGKDKKALYFHFKALELSKTVNIINRTALVHENIARVYLHQKKYALASAHLDSSEMIRKETGEVNGLAAIHLVRASILMEQNQVAQAINEGKAALSIGEEVHLAHIQKEAHSLLQEAYELQGNNDKALFHFKRYIHLKDSIFDLDQSKELLRKELEFNFQRTQDSTKLITSKKVEKAKQESEKQKTIIAYASIALLIVTLLLGFSYWQYRLKNKSKKQLELANIDLNDKNQELQNKSDIIEAQHTTIRLKNEEITDSIRYAFQIQQAVLPGEKDFIQHFDDAFVLFQPKDLISGDFYWIHETKHELLFATVDCTGHGVPGGFMSMLGFSFLNELANEQGLTEPAIILTRLREKVISSLRQKGVSGEQQDGMDMTLISLSKKGKKLSFATANHVFYILRDNEIVEYRGNKFPVGIFGEDLPGFEQHEILFEKGDRLYTFTDGFADQFGGPKGKKFKHQQLKELLLSTSVLSMDEQKLELKLAFENWKGDLEQVDDVCLIGVLL